MHTVLFLCFISYITSFYMSVAAFADIFQGFFNDSWAWWRHQMETFSALLAICAGNSPVPGEFPAQRPVMRSFNVFFEMPSRSLWRHYNDLLFCFVVWELFSFSSAMASQITSLTIVYSTVDPGANQRKHQSPASPALCGEFTGDR